MTDDLPIAVELKPLPDLTQAFRRMSRLPHCLFLDSVMRHPTLGRYSYLAADPLEFVTAAPGAPDPLGRLRDRWRSEQGRGRPGLPPFQGGTAGLFSYDMNRALERIPAPRYDEFGVPALALGWYDVVLAVDHLQQRAWLVSQGWPAGSRRQRRREARARLAHFAARLDGSHSAPAALGQSGEPLAAARLAPQFPVSRSGLLTSNFSESEYCRTVARTVDYIHAGDAFQVNIAQRLLHAAHEPSADLYLRLRHCNPAPYAGYFDLGAFQILSASPELFLSVRDGVVETRPIKGTRPRCGCPEADLPAAVELQQSAKDRAENIMIVDLLRNDLSRVCRPDSVRVVQLCGLETYQYVQHLVSVVRGRLAAEHGPWELIAAAFPGGSITGAPKVRAMEIIAELEPTARGPYCGSLGYVGVDGAVDLNILIRTITAGRGWWQIPVGGGIVAESSPRREYEETWHKAHGLLRAVHTADVVLS